MRKLTVYRLTQNQDHAANRSAAAVELLEKVKELSALQVSSPLIVRDLAKARQGSYEQLVSVKNQLAADRDAALRSTISLEERLRVVEDSKAVQLAGLQQELEQLEREAQQLRQRDAQVYLPYRALRAS